MSWVSHCNCKWGLSYPAYIRGQAYLAAHNGNAAAAEFQKLLDHRGIVINFPLGALAHLQLGRAPCQVRAKIGAAVQLPAGSDPEHIAQELQQKVRNTVDQRFFSRVSNSAAWLSAATLL